MKKLFRVVVRFLIPAAVLGAAIWTTSVLMASAPRTERTSEPRLPPVVDVAPLEAQTVPRIVDASGTVLPAEEVTISPEVDGRITEIHPALQPGGIIHKGDLLVRIDAEQYELAVSSAKATLAGAEAALEIEQGRRRVAEREWELFGKDLANAEMGRELALREPQLNQAKAQIASARNAVAQAELDLRRTAVYAPFDALVLSENVDLGQHVGPGDTIASLAGTSAFWIKATLAAEKFNAFLSSSKDESPVVRVYNDLNGKAGEPAAIGHLLRHLGQVNQEGQMAEILVEVADSLLIEKPSATGRPLLLNSFVRLEVDVPPLENAIAIPWSGLRENSELWIADAGDRLKMYPADVIWTQVDGVAVADTFSPGDRLIVSPLNEVLPGMQVRVRDAAAATAPSPQELATQ